MTRSQQRNQQDYLSKILYELSSLVFNILRSPPPSVDFPDHAPPVLVQRRRREGPSLQQITTAGFASLLLGISLSLMLCGSVTFFLGFILMPWVLGLVIFFYFVGIVSSISMIGRAILRYPLFLNSFIGLEALMRGILNNWTFILKDLAALLWVGLFAALGLCMV